MTAFPSLRFHFSHGIPFFFDETTSCLMKFRTRNHVPRRRQILPVLLAILCAIPFSHGAEPQSLSRDEAIWLAFRNNRELAVAVLEIDRAKTRLRWSGRLENPELEFSLKGDGIGNDEDEGNYEVAFSQQFPVTARLKQERHLRGHQVILAEAEIAERKRQLAGEVDLALVSLLMIREKIAVSRQLVDLNEEMIEFLERQSEEGVISSLDVMQAKLASRTLEQKARKLATEETHHLLALNKVLGLSPDTPINIEESTHLPQAKPSMEASLRTILPRRPDYVLALEKIDAARAALTFEEAKRWQDVSVRLFVEQQDSVDVPTGLDGNTFAGFGISIPLPLRKRNQEGIEQAQINQQAADKEVEAARFRIQAECEEAFHERSDTWNLARDASDELLSLAEKNEEEFRKAYQQGQASLIQVQRAQEQVLELKHTILEFLAAYHEAEANVRLATGAYPGLTIETSKNPK